MASKAKKKRRQQSRRRVRGREAEPAASERPEDVRFCMMAKPAGPACNLRCQYCFYLEKEALFDGAAAHRMSDEVLEVYTRKYLEQSPPGPVAFHWQGGEPTLMGLDFYRKAVELQRRFADGRAVSNTIQTNGTLFDDEWGRFLAAGKWMVGLSLDGPREIHDQYRLDAAGKGTFDAVMRGLAILQRHKVEYNVLSCVTPASTRDPLAVYDFLKGAGVGFVQFMPIVERLPDEVAAELGLQLAVGIRSGEKVQTLRMTPWSVEPEAYGDFLITIFDEWVRHDVGSFAVMNFEWALANVRRACASGCRAAAARRSSSTTATCTPATTTSIRSTVWATS